MLSIEAEALTKEVKEYALKNGATLIGVVSVENVDSKPRIWVGWKIRSYTQKTSEIMPEAKSIVVLGYHVWDTVFELAVKHGDKWTYPGYYPLKFIELKLTYYLKMKGFKAVPISRMSLKTLAKLAGFGNFGKNSLIINPVYGPWIRFAAILTDAELIPDKPFEYDLCGDCEACVEACPVNALTPYKVDDRKCLVGVHLNDCQDAHYLELFERYEPSITRNSHLMCIECQRVCRYGGNLHY